MDIAHTIVGLIATVCVTAGFTLGIIFIIENIRNK
jgi:hypothetical protein